MSGSAKISSSVAQSGGASGSGARFNPCDLRDGESINVSVLVIMEILSPDSGQCLVYNNIPVLASIGAVTTWSYTGKITKAGDGFYFEFDPPDQPYYVIGGGAITLTSFENDECPNGRANGTSVSDRIIYFSVSGNCATGNVEVVSLPTASTISAAFVDKRLYPADPRAIDPFIVGGPLPWTGEATISDPGNEGYFGFSAKQTWIIA